MSSFRHLTPEEIATLSAAGCSAQDWQNVEVSSDFDPSRYQYVSFSGHVTLGSTASANFQLDSPIPYRAGISRARLHDVNIGNGVYIADISNYIANVDIADNCFIENVDRISATEGATCGIGTEVSVLNETGGREVPIYPGLSAHIAYLMAIYRHDERLSRSINRLVEVEKHRMSQRRVTIHANALIRNCGTITDVNIGEFAIIEGASRLSNGTIDSCEADPVEVGVGVVAQDFIFASGSKVADGALVLHSYIGQGTHIMRQFSAHDCLFFANCTCENGEAAAVFAGPYTVTMHKSSLLIAGMFSFLNAGSGSNQSNHMYKLGPIHQGIVERGSKTTSDSYILWPAHIGAFSLVMGRHVSHPDTSDLPFSYLIEDHSGAHLVPAANIRSVGTIRDAQKWPKRDRRRDPHKLDFINFNLLSPFTVSKMMRGIRLLDSLEETGGVTSEVYSFQGMTIKASSLRKGRKYYAMGIAKFFGNSVIKRLEAAASGRTEEIRRLLAPTHNAGEGNWIDVAGLIAPKREIDATISAIIDGSLNSLAQINDRLASLARDYYDMEWTWVASMMEEWWGKPVDQFTREDVLDIVDLWQRAVLDIDNSLLTDARKEFSRVAQIGFGVDDSSRRDIDFDNVRGRFETDPFVEMARRHIIDKSALADDLRSRLNG